MKTTTKTDGDHIPCGMVSLKMFQMNHSKALIIAYLDMRSGPRMKNYIFNITDISNQTNIGKTVVRQFVKELLAEGVLNRKGKSFYKLNRQKMEESYYRQVSESDADVSKSDTQLSETDADVSESDSLHSSNLNSRKIDSSKLDTSKLDTSKLYSTGNTAPKLPEIVEEFLSKSPKEQVAWLDDIEANRTMKKMLKNAKAGKDVEMTPEFAYYFANM